MINPKASAVSAPTPGWVIKRTASGRFSGDSVHSRVNALLISAATLPRFVVLVLNLAAAARFHGSERYANNVLTELQHRRLLLAVFVFVTDRQVMLALFRDNPSADNPATPANLLPILEALDSIVRNLEFALAVVKQENLLVAGG